MNTNRKVAIVSAVAPAVVFAAVALSGCAANPEDDAPRTTPSPSAPGSLPPDTPSSGAVDDLPPSPTGTQIVLELDGQEIAGQLDDSPTAGSLAARLPLTLTFADHGGQEKYAELPEALDLTGAPQSSDAEPGQIGYYVPDQRLILYYDHVGTFSGIVPIGSYDSADAVESQSGEFTVTIRDAD